MMSWLLVGVAALLVGVATLLTLTNAIVAPVVTAAIIAAVLSPLVAVAATQAGSRARRRRARVRGHPRARRVAARPAARRRHQPGGRAREGAQERRRPSSRAPLQDAGVSAADAQKAKADASSSLSGAFHALLDGVGTGVKVLGSLAIFASFAALSLFFLLKDGPQIRRWAERHMGVPHAVGRTITDRTLQALRGYFTGVTAVAAFNAIVIGLGALVLDVGHVGAIMLVNFAAAYIPYLGAWSAGAFTVLLTLGSQGTTAALIMAVIVLLANGMLQQLIQPIAFGAALGIHPLAVLIVTIAGGSLFGMIGLVLAAPLTAAATHILSDLARARAEAAERPPRPRRSHRSRPSAPDRGGLRCSRARSASRATRWCCSTSSAASWTPTRPSCRSSDVRAAGWSAGRSPS